MHKSTLFTLIVLGGLLLLAQNASALTPKPRPPGLPINPIPPVTGQPVVSAT